MGANSRPSSLSLIFRSYLGDLRQWIGHLVTGYALAGGFMLVGAVSLVVAIGIGVAAAFHALEVRFDIWIAYAVVGCAFLVIALAGFVVGRALLARPAPEVPRPSRQADMLKRSIAAPVAARLIAASRPGAAAGVDPTTQALAAGAAIMLVGWFAASRFRRRPDAFQD
ncbi:phage holin family protein [Bradyrhizobium acaciae]|uniref:phage holin family protein n=1 Tax=Bradyrhizobium acaciae TaxID=2683706 RepID=UPI001E5124C0|nr:phage holin family protein [Bradyrhizobium acaciae]MCC8981474.1 phage holin family protein [Bradyrhizobium acaciae]